MLSLKHSAQTNNIDICRLNTVLTGVADAGAIDLIQLGPGETITPLVVKMLLEKWLSTSQEDDDTDSGPALISALTLQEPCKPGIGDNLWWYNHLIAP